MTEAAETPTPLRSRLAAGAAALLTAALAVGGLAALHARAGADAAPAAAPIPVVVAPIRLTDGYAVAERHVGRIEAARATEAGFERGGLLLSVAVEAGDRVAAGAALARLDDAALHVERRRVAAERAAAEADLALAQATLTRRARLSDGGFATGQSLDEAQAAADGAGARIAALDARLAALALEIDKSVLRAPFDAVVAARRVDEGAVVAAGTPALRLIEAGRPRARIGAPAELAATLAPGATVEIVTQAGAIPGRIAAAPPELDAATQTVDLLVDLPPDQPAPIGATAWLTIERPEQGRGAWVPLSALREGPRGLWSVWIAADGPGGADDPVAREALVQALHVADGRAYVAGALADGDSVVAAGADRLTAGQPLRVTDATP
jgi:RND family efflux transporter MFP subunit